MASQQDKTLVTHLLILLDRITKLPEECLTRLFKNKEAQDFAVRLAKGDPASFASFLERVVLSDPLNFFTILEETYFAIRKQHGVELAKLKQEATDAQLARELTAREEEGERAAKRRKVDNETNVPCRRPSAGAVDDATATEDRPEDATATEHRPEDATATEDRPEDATATEHRPEGGENAGRKSPSSSVSSGSSRASSRSRSPVEQAHLGQQPSAQIETGESSGDAAIRTNERSGTSQSLFLTDEDFELGITTAAPSAVAKVKETWNALGDPRDVRRKKFDCVHEQDMVISCVMKLDFMIVGPLLVEYLSRRVWIMSQSDQQPSIAELARLATSQETHPFQRFKALNGMTCAGHHDWIQRVYGEILLWESVQAQVDKRSDAILLTRPKSKISEHQKILKGFAREAAEKEGYKKQKDIDRIIAQFERHFYAGLRWRNVAKEFNGSGIIIAFIVADFRASVVGSVLTEYQRRCLANVSGRLPRIGRLVQAMGDDALQVYCKRGCLPPDRIVSVEELVKEHTGFEVNDDV